MPNTSLTPQPQIRDIGGNRSITLTTENIPEHNHSLTINNNDAPHTHPSPGNTSNPSTDLNHIHGFTTSRGGEHTHTVDGRDEGEDGGHCRDRRCNAVLLTDRGAHRRHHGEGWTFNSYQGLANHIHTGNTGNPNADNNLVHTHQIPAIPRSDYPVPTGGTGATQENTNLAAATSTLHNHTGSIGNTGGNVAIDITPPYIALRYIIKLPIPS